MLGHTINPFALPYVDLDDKTDLPSKPGLYFVVDGSMLLYIGKSKNMKSRWGGHHRYKQLKAIALNPQIAFLDLEDEELLSAERSLIDRFKPPLNDTRIDAVQSLDDLKALIEEMNPVPTDFNAARPDYRKKFKQPAGAGEEDTQLNPATDEIIRLMGQIPSTELSAVLKAGKSMYVRRREYEFRTYLEHIAIYVDGDVKLAQLFGEKLIDITKKVFPITQDESTP